MSERKIYFGIDLGTTNSSISWGMDTGKNFIEPNIVPIEQMDSNGGISNHDLLPSCVYFRENDENIIGLYAKSQISTQPNSVAFSIKSLMGSKDQIKFEGNMYLPSDISGLILKTLKKQAESYMQSEINDVVITVPASFDPDMRKATLEAAEKAGFKLKDSITGRQLVHLLDEPVAALYDFINLQKMNKIPPNVLDLSTEKNILVYDLGGGTLDVSVHKVSFKENKLIILDLGISRYTLIGGDDFDKKIAEYLFDIFIKQNKLEDELENFDEFEIKEAKSKLLQYSEYIKFKLTQLFLSRSLFPKENWNYEKELEEIKISVQPGYILDNKMLVNYNLTFKDYISIVSDLLGNNLTINSLDSFNPSEQPPKNIVYAILDTLNKVKKKLGYLPQIDAILMNGGMTRVPFVEKRIEDFFNKKPLRIIDPDKSVSMGACVYHYALLKGDVRRAIQPETIYIKLEGENQFPLVNAGENLPYEMIFSQFILPKHVTHLQIPLVRGEQKSTLISRDFSLGQMFEDDEPVSIKVTVNEEKILDFEAFLTKYNDKKFKVKLSTEEITVIEEKNTFKNELDKGNEVKEIRNVSQPITPKNPDGPVYNENLFENELKRLSRSNNERDFKIWEHKVLDSQNLNLLVPSIQSYLSFYFKQRNFITSKRLIHLLGEIYSIYPNYKLQQNYENFFDFLKSTFKFKEQTPNTDREFRNINETIRFSIDVLGKIDHEKGNQYLFNLLVDSRYQQREFLTSIITSIGKISKSESNLKAVVKFGESNQFTKLSEHEIGVFYWTLGKLGSKEVGDPISIEIIPMKILQSIKNTSLDEQSNISKRLMAIYAIAELFDNRYENKLNNENQLFRLGILKDFKELLMNLESLSTLPQGKMDLNAFKKYQQSKYGNEKPEKIEHLKRMIKVAINLLEGKPLNVEESSALLQIRSKLKITT